MLAAYYIIHNPFVPANVLAVEEAMAGLAGAGMVLRIGLFVLLLVELWRGVKG